MFIEQSAPRLLVNVAKSACGAIILTIVLSVISYTVFANSSVAQWQVNSDNEQLKATIKTGQGKHAFRVALICPLGPESGKQGLSLSLEKLAGDIDPSNGVHGIVGFFKQNKQSVTWRVDGSMAHAGIDPNLLASGVEKSFRFTQKLTIQASFIKNPISITVGKGPYAGVMSEFLANCPITSKDMPTLVRIKKSRVVLWEDLPADQRPSRSNSTPVPVYPYAIVKNHISGKVLVAGAITPKGKVLWPVVIKSSGHPLLDKEALKSMRETRFDNVHIDEGALILDFRSFRFEP